MQAFSEFCQAVWRRDQRAIFIIAIIGKGSNLLCHGFAGFAVAQSVEPEFISQMTFKPFA